MIVGLLMGAIALYFILGWLVMLLTKSAPADARSSNHPVLGLVFWPIGVIASIVRRASAPKDGGHKTP